VGGSLPLMCSCKSLYYIFTISSQRKIIGDGDLVLNQNNSLENTGLQNVVCPFYCLFPIIPVLVKFEFLDDLANYIEKYIHIHYTKCIEYKNILLDVSHNIKMVV
jgi:hypothetical protein